MDQEHLRIVDIPFLIPCLEIPPSSLSYDLSNVLSNSPSFFACDLAVAIDSIPHMESITSIPIVPSSYGPEEYNADAILEPLDGSNRKEELISCTSCSSSSSSSIENFCKGAKEKALNNEYNPNGLLARMTGGGVDGDRGGGGKGSGNKKKARIRKRISSLKTRLYVCDWCFGKASFKSCQGLRFHKTLRCPERERKLGEDYFKCTKCKKAFITSKGLNHHIVGTNHWPD